MAQRVWLVNAGSLFALFVFLVLTLGIAMELSASVLFADFCKLGPATALSDLSNQYLSNKDLTVDVVEYYALTCQDSNCTSRDDNPLLSGVSTCSDSLHTIRSLFSNSDFCNSTTTDAHSTSVSRLDSYAADGLNILGNFTLDMDCEVFYPSFYDTAQNQVCDKIVSGLAQLWGIHLVTACLLFIVIILASYVKQHVRIAQLMAEDGAVKAVPIGPPLFPKIA